MNIILTGTKIKLTPAIKRYVDEKYDVLSRHLNGEVLCRVELEMMRGIKSADIFRAEVNLSTEHVTLRAEAAANDMYAAIDMTIPKIIIQIEKQKHKKESKDKKLGRQVKEGEIEF